MTTRYPSALIGGVDHRAPRVNFRLPSLELRKQLEDAALAHRTTINGYVRSLVLDALRKEREQTDYNETANFFG